MIRFSSARWLALVLIALVRAAQVRGDLPPQKCRAALDSVVFVEEPWQEESGSVLADIVAHLGQDVSILDSFLLCCCAVVSYQWLDEVCMNSQLATGG
jgi:hypothetical protein